MKFRTSPFIENNSVPDPIKCCWFQFGTLSENCVLNNPYKRDTPGRSSEGETITLNLFLEKCILGLGLIDICILVYLHSLFTVASFAKSKLKHEKI
jgi:hypothetical protein